ncbi:unnamed protein product [Rhizophagus irregularis]|uniref:Low temperature viability protein n=1 Tax=Rhizophagus irregularis TaxID=588596 RepID=A0A2I1FSN7_9GLOM|nr:Low temperature viability protein [Rhizophagus irregularis]CAB4403932.1 unnamed protein product [Rhizophagus irregularis]
MGKKPFIDRKNAKYFQVVHRSQRDPLINDNEASSRVLVEVVPSNLRGKSKQIVEHNDFDDYQRSQKEIESRVGQAALYGVYFDDTEYDYLQHLKQIGENEGEAVFVDASKKEKKTVGNFELKKSLKSDDNKDVLVSSKKDRKVKISLPEEVLPSKEELPVGFLNQSAIPEDIQGFQPDMDPKLRETLEALEDGAYINDDLDDDFFAALNAEDIEFYEEEEEDSEHDEKEAENWELEYKKFRKNKNREKESDDDDDDDDDKRSRTTGGYSMTSSIMFRNDKLRLLDEQFEKISKEYIDDDDESDDESTSSQIRQDFSQILDEFLDKYEINGRKVVQKLEGDNAQDQLETIRQGLGKVIVNDDNSSQNETIKEEKRGDIFVHVDSEEKDEGQNWDCQSILSTYSNLENHPTLIREKSRKKSQKININQKTGLPIVKLSTENKTDEEEEEERDKGIEKQEKEENEKVNFGKARSKNEPKEEKKLRKQNIKSERKKRRTEKKSLKQAFAKEHTKQNKISHNISKNHLDAIHLD